MPGFILHMSTSQMLFNKYNVHADRNSFEVGNLIPDSVSDKTFSHFRHPSRNEKLMVYPDLDLFLKKYGQLLHDSSCLGYYFHLYIDRVYAKDYIPQIVTFYDAEGSEASNRIDITHALIKRTNELVSIKTFFSDEYYYGDFTKLNTYLVHRFQLNTTFKEIPENPGITEVNYHNILSIQNQLDSYLNISEDAVHTLKVFDPDHLICFLENATDNFIYHIKNATA